MVECGTHESRDERVRLTAKGGPFRLKKCDHEERVVPQFGDARLAVRSVTAREAQAGILKQDLPAGLQAKVAVVLLDDPGLADPHGRQRIRLNTDMALHFHK
jgi:hypothetical protein